MFVSELTEEEMLQYFEIVFNGHLEGATSLSDLGDVDTCIDFINREAINFFYVFGILYEELPLSINDKYLGDYEHKVIKWRLLIGK